MEEVPLSDPKNDAGAESLFIYGLLLTVVFSLFSFLSFAFHKGIREDKQKQRMFLFGVGAGLVVQVTVVVGVRWFISNKA